MQLPVLHDQTNNNNSKHNKHIQTDQLTDALTSNKLNQTWRVTRNMSRAVSVRTSNWTNSRHRQSVAYNCILSSTMCDGFCRNDQTHYYVVISMTHHNHSTSEMTWTLHTAYSVCRWAAKPTREQPRSITCLWRVSAVLVKCTAITNIHASAISRATSWQHCHATPWQCRHDITQILLPMRPRQHWQWTVSTDEMQRHE